MAAIRADRRRAPQTATNKILKRALISDRVTAGDGELWERESRGREYKPT